MDNNILLVTVLSLSLFLLFSIYNSLYGPITDLIKSKLIVVITGCDSGFGLDTAKLLSSLGFIVLGLCYTEQGTESLKAFVTLAIQGDVTKDEDIARLAKETENLCENTNGNLWCVVNNAGIAPMGYIDWLPMSVIRKVMDTNYIAPIAISKALLPLLKKTKGSRIINVSSMAGLSGTALLGAYCASKHAIEGVGKCFRKELSLWDIHLAHVNPGFMKTPLINSSTVIGYETYKQAHEDLRKQYPEHLLTNMVGIVDKLQENPSIVSSAIVKLVSAKYPAFNNYVGTQSFLLRIYLTFPVIIQDFLMSLVTKSAAIPKDVLDEIRQSK